MKTRHRIPDNVQYAGFAKRLKAFAFIFSPDRNKFFTLRFGIGEVKPQRGQLCICHLGEDAG